jgi:Tfp pilus assembly protein PilF
MNSISFFRSLARLRATQRGRRVAFYVPVGILGLLAGGCGGSSPFTLPSVPSFSQNASPTSVQTAPVNHETAVGMDYLQAAHYHESQGNWEEAARQYESALQAHPGQTRTIVSYARLLDRQEQFEKAERMYREALRWEPQNASIYNDLGLCQARAGRLDASLQSLGQAVQLQPGEVRFRNNLAKVLVEVGRHEDGLKHLSAVHPPAIAHHNLALFLQGKQENELATRHFTRALELDSSLASENRIQTAARTTQKPADPQPQPNARPRSYAAAVWHAPGRAPAGRGATRPESETQLSRQPSAAPSSVPQPGWSPDARWAERPTNSSSMEPTLGEFPPWR